MPGQSCERGCDDRPDLARLQMRCADERMSAALLDEPEGQEACQGCRSRETAGKLAHPCEPPLATPRLTKISAAESAAAPSQSMLPGESAVDSGHISHCQDDGDDADDEDHEKDRSETPMVGEHAAEKLVGPGDSAADRGYESQRGAKLRGRQNIAENQVDNLIYRAGCPLQNDALRRGLQHWGRASPRRFLRTSRPASKSEFFCVPQGRCSASELCRQLRRPGRTMSARCRRGPGSRRACVRFPEPRGLPSMRSAGRRSRQEAARSAWPISSRYSREWMASGLPSSELPGGGEHV